MVLVVLVVVAGGVADAGAGADAAGSRANQSGGNVATQTQAQHSSVGQGGTTDIVRR